MNVIGKAVLITDSYLFGFILVRKTWSLGVVGVETNRASVFTNYFTVQRGVHVATCEFFLQSREKTAILRCNSDTEHGDGCENRFLESGSEKSYSMAGIHVEELNKRERDFIGF